MADETYGEIEIVVRQDGNTWRAKFPKCYFDGVPWEIEYEDYYPNDPKNPVCAIRRIKKMKFVFLPLMNEATLEYGTLSVDTREMGGTKA